MAKDSAIHNRVKALGIQLLEPFRPVGLYKPVSLAGNRLYVSGHGPWVEGKTPIRGRLGASMSVSEGKLAARQVGVGILSTLEHEVGLESIERLFRTFGMVNSLSSFERQPEVIDGFSSLMRAVFGPDNGVGARSAIGVASLPFGIAVEIECEFILR